MPNQGYPLSGVRVLDLTRYEAGPTCTLLLAFLGAEVIKVESAREGYAQRRLFHEKGSKEDLYFILLNLNKKSITLDLKHDRARFLLEKILHYSDVLVESFGSEKLARMGLGYERMQELNPKLIVASISGYGSSGPYANYPSLDMTAQAMGGIMSLTGEEGQPPLRCGVTVADSAGGTNLALGIVAALYRREKTGLGGRVEVSLQDTALGLGRSILGTHIAYGSKARRSGNRLKDVVPWDIYAARDGWVAVCVIPNRLFERLMQAIGGERILKSHNVRTIEDRVRHRALIDGLLKEWVSRRDRFEVMKVLGEQGIPCGAVLDSDHIRHDPHVQERNMLVEIEHPEWGPVQVVGCPIKFPGESELLRCSPGLGQHTREILFTILGVSPEDAELLEKEGAVGASAEVR